MVLLMYFYSSNLLCSWHLGVVSSLMLKVSSGKGSQHSSMRGMGSKVPFLAEELRAVDSYWGKDSHVTML